MNPSPEQIAEWRKEFEAPARKFAEFTPELFERESDCEYGNMYVESEWQGYLRARTEQATEIAELKALAANLKQEAQIHAMEARGANATINEINQFISGATGEPANWHGAQPVKEFVNELKAKLAEVMPLAKFGALTLRRHRAGDGNNDVEFDELAQDAISSKVTLEVRVTEACSEFCSCVDYVGENGFPTICLQSAPNIEATIEQLLKD